MYKFTILAALLFVSFGFSSVYAEENTFLNPDNLSFDKVPDKFLPKPSSESFDSLSAQESNLKSYDKKLSAINNEINDSTFVNPDTFSFKYVPQKLLPKPTPSSFMDPLTGEEIVLKSGHYFQYPSESGAAINSNEKQLVSLDDQEFYLVPDTLDKTANLFAILILGIPFGILVYRMSDEDPIPLKYAKLSGVAVFFAMASMLTMPVAIGNSFWGYAFASSDSETNVSVPKPVDSLYFDSSNKFTSNEANIISDKENSALQLDGKNDYLVFDSNLSERLDQFSVSAWVKPDYKKGIPSTLSIISEANSFDLSINNNKVDKSVAIFSVYDGIKWHQVQSNSAIPESWTHVSATYSDNELRIFVNGIHENYKQIDGDYSLTYQYGESSQNSLNYISSTSDILIGAFNPSIREDSSIQNHFSGLIDDVTLYDKLLSAGQISALDSNNRTPDIIPEQKVQTVETSVEQTGTANEYGFVADENNPNNQNIEESASEGYKVKKPEDKKKEETPEQSSDTSVTALENNPADSDESKVDSNETDSTSNVTEFDSAKVVTNSTSSIDSQTNDASTVSTSETDTTSNVTEIDVEDTTNSTSSIDSQTNDTSTVSTSETDTTSNVTKFDGAEVSTSSDSSSNTRQPTSESKSTDDVTEFSLIHSPIEIGKEVHWNQTVLFSNETSLAEIDVPSDAALTRITTTDGKVIPLAALSAVNKSSANIPSKAVLDEFNPQIIQNKSNTKVISIPNPSSGVLIEFVTDAPGITENILKQSSNSFEKHVSVSHESALHYSGVLTYSEIPEEVFETHNLEDIHLLWINDNQNGSETIDVTNNPQYNVQLVDTDQNGIPDLLQWSVPQLSEQSFVILITAAEHLDSGRVFIADVYEQVAHIDGNWLEEVPVNDYIRVTFEQNITSANSIDVYAKSANPSSESFIEIYEKNSGSIVATIGPITTGGMYSAKLTSLVGLQDTFDLRIVGDAIDFEYIQDANFSINLDQCGNGPLDDPVKCDGIGEDNWQNGNLNENQAHYAEGQTVPYRARMTLPGNETITLVLSYDSTKAHQHAIDYLKTFNATETDANPCKLKVGPSIVDICSIDDGVSIPVPIPINNLIDYDHDPTVLPLVADGPSQPETQWTFEQAANPDDFLFWIFPGDASDIISIDSIRYLNSTNNNYSTDYSSDPLDSTADTTQYYEVNFTTTGEAATAAWGGHIASRAYWGFDDAGTDAGEPNTEPSGSPYHATLRELFGNETVNNVGSQDRSLAVAAVIAPLATINITKVSLDGNSTFSFQTSDNLISTTFDGTFTIDTDVNSTKIFEVLLGGNYTFTETDPAPDYKLASIDCSAEQGSTFHIDSEFTIRVNLTNPQDLAPDGEVASCVFTNQAIANLTIVKEVVGGNATFKFNVTDTGANATFGGESIDDGFGNFTINTETDLTNSLNFTNVNATTYEVVEFIDELDEWVYDSVSCVDGTDGTPFAFSGDGTVGSPLVVDLDAGDDVICTYVNTRGADLIVTKTEGFDPAIAGEDLWYIINVTNAGPADAENVFLNDTAPTGTTFVLSNGTEVNPIVGTTFAEWTLGTITAGASEFINVTINIPSDIAATTLINTAAANSTTFEEDLTNNEDDEETSLNADADLALVKSDNGTSATAGLTYTYTVNVTNNGPSVAENVTITDEIPAGTTFDSASDGGSANATHVTWPEIASVAVDASVEYTVTLLVDADFAGDEIINIANVTSDTNDNNTDNNGDDEQTPVNATADLSILKDDNNVTAMAGENLSYNITVTNEGPSDAQDVIVTDILANGTTFVSSNTTTVGPASVGDTIVKWSLGTIGVGETVQIEITVFVASNVTTGLLNIANTTSTTPDDNSTNNEEEEPTPIDVLADLVLDKSDNNQNAIAGQPYTYTINVTNAGPSDAQNVTITDTLPANTTFVSADPAEESFNATHVTWPEIETIAAGGSVEYTITVLVGENVTFGSTLVNIANVTTDTFENNTDNNGDDEPTTVGILAGLTPGFYKNNADSFNAASWVLENPTDDFSDAFGLSEEVTLRGEGRERFENATLRQALDANGGGINALARHCVAAKLNAEHPAIDYPIQDALVVIEMCRQAIEDGSNREIRSLANLLDEYNNLGSPIVDQHWPN